MSRNVFDQTPEEEPETYEVPLRMGIGGPVIGTAKVTKDGEVVGEVTITDEEAKKKLQPPAYSFSLPDPADRYRAQ
ncbi:hypothetical protein SEA_ANNIHILUS_44 [Streptomyces phage Annihilus]|nr:hypothetical protein SEA_ANNIHILUS_44 [Streptomyces phage Annihilus]